MSDVKLFKKQSSYIDEKDGKEKTVTNFFVAVGDALIPVAIKYFPSKEDGIDRAYSGRKQVLSAIATTLPEKVDK